MTPYADQFLGLPPVAFEQADAVLMSLPFEQTVSYGRGTGRAPGAIFHASRQLELFDEETQVDFNVRPRIHTATPVLRRNGLEAYLQCAEHELRRFRGRFTVTLGGEHTISYAAVRGLAPDLHKLTIVHVDAHADLADTLHGAHWSHGTVMRRLWEHGCRLIQIGIRSQSRAEFDLIHSGERITTFFAHDLVERWNEAMVLLSGLEGDVYLSFDVDGLDPSVLPSTGTPQPDGLTWRQAMTLMQTLCAAPCHFLGGDFVEFVPEPEPPGWDIVAAKLVYKLLAYRTISARSR